MKALITTNPMPREEEPKERLGEKLRRFLKSLPHSKKIKGHGHFSTVSSEWTEEDIRVLLRAIHRKCPGISDIHIYKREISFTFQCTPEEFLGRRKEGVKELSNPSRRKLQRQKVEPETKAVY